VFHSKLKAGFFKEYPKRSEEDCRLDFPATRIVWDLLDERVEALFLRRAVAQQLVHAVVPHMLMQQDAGEGFSRSD
jgi:hypothetical protein